MQKLSGKEISRRKFLSATVGGLAYLSGCLGESPSSDGQTSEVSQKQESSGNGDGKQSAKSAKNTGAETSGDADEKDSESSQLSSKEEEKGSEAESVTVSEEPVMKLQKPVSMTITYEQTKDFEMSVEGDVEPPVTIEAIKRETRNLIIKKVEPKKVDIGETFVVTIENTGQIKIPEILKLKLTSSSGEEEVKQLRFNNTV